MKIVHLAAEFAPLAKAGGLGEVLLGLSRELTRKGHEVEVILPKYNFIDVNKMSGTKIEPIHFKCLEYPTRVWSGRSEECSISLLESTHPAAYFDRGKIYGCDDDAARFIYFSRACIEYLALKNEPIDILHLHDWHTSLCAPLAKELFKSIPIRSIALSIHNIEYQGKCGQADLDGAGLDGSYYLHPNRLQDDNPNFPNTVNLLKGGIVYADGIIPVSPSYAKEILIPEFGFNLETTLQGMKRKIRGILNGIDTAIWNPETDSSLNPRYGIESSEKGKRGNRALFPLDRQKRPWVGAVTRLVPQKGTELIEEAMRTTIAAGGSFLLLGSSPIPEIQAHFDRLQQKYHNHPQIFLRYEYSELLAHRIYAALDLLIVPSRFEPCGLTQLIGMRYGTVPLVRSTGGLKDTVFDCEDRTIPASSRNGFVFPDPTPSSMNGALRRAFDLFRSDPATFRALIRRGMSSDFSWKKPAEKYLQFYRSLNMNPVRIDVIDDRNQSIESRCGSCKQADLLK